jgi:hypothetical protein
MVNYYIRLLKSDGLLSESFSTSKTLFNNDKNSWFGCIDALLQYLNVNTNYLLKSKLNVKKYLLSKLRIKYKAIWRQELFRDNSGQGYGNKLQTYRLFKNTFNFEHYISCAQW